MLKLIVGKKGTGKTKLLISMVNDAVAKSDGKVVCIEKGKKLTYDIHHGARLIDTEAYNIAGYDVFFGFLAGVTAGDFDVNEVYVDSVLKICGSDRVKLAEFLDKINRLSEQDNVTFIFTVSADEEELPDTAKKYIA
ncbi:MAG: hypothetical protein P4L75_02905 [Clostridia bacterium]|nr:hypothetical protein [Clostridia bacterium]MDR3645376.1 hypothetical protein [Clostridia bacterium]